MIWIVILCGILLCEYFRERAEYYECEANWWRNEAEKRVKKEEAFEVWMPTGGRHPLDWSDN
jgi:hypothetical protein